MARANTQNPPIEPQTPTTPPVDPEVTPPTPPVQSSTSATLDEIAALREALGAIYNITQVDKSRTDVSARYNAHKLAGEAIGWPVSDLAISAAERS